MQFLVIIVPLHPTFFFYIQCEIPSPEVWYGLIWLNSHRWRVLTLNCLLDANNSVNASQTRLAWTCAPPAMLAMFGSRRGRFKTWTEFRLHLKINVLSFTQVFLIEAVSLLHYVGPCAMVAELVPITGSEIHTTQVTTNRWVIARPHNRIHHYS